MKSKLSRDIKRKFKNDIFTNLIKEDIEKYGKGMHSINSAYIGIEWALNQSEDVKEIIIGYNKGFQDAVEKAIQIIISYMPLPSNKNHNMNFDVDLLKERQKYAHQVAKKFEELMNTDER